MAPNGQLGLGRAAAQGRAPDRPDQRNRRASPPLPVEPEEEELARRGSHATLSGQGFSWVLLWTILGAFIPGAGLIAAGWRRLGALLLFLVGLGVVSLALLVKFGNVLRQGVSLAVDPQKLLILAVAVGTGAAIWALLVVLTNTQLRRYATLTPGQSAFSTLVLVALVAGIALPAYKISSTALITRDVVTSPSVFQGGGSDTTSTRPNVQQADPWADRPRMNVLLIGSDAGADRTGIRPDTLILASINTKTGNTVLFSLPRNLQHAPFPVGTGGYRAWPNGFYCPTVGTGQDCLLNAIWTWASGDGHQYYKKFKNPGLQATRDAVQGVTGLKVDTYVMLNLAGFRDFVDAIGGLTVDVHERLPIGGNSEHPVAVGGYIEPGNNQKLNGFHALWFARSRWSTSDYDRMQRQRCVIGDVVNQANPMKLALAFPQIAKTLKSNLSTGIATSDLQAWVDLSLRVQKAKVTSLPFTNSLINSTNPDFTQIHELVAQALKASNATKPKPTPTVSASATTTVKKKKKTTTTTPFNPAKAQDVKAVC